MAAATLNSRVRWKCFPQAGQVAALPYRIRTKSLPKAKSHGKPLDHTSAPGDQRVRERVHCPVAGYCFAPFWSFLLVQSSFESWFWGKVMNTQENWEANVYLIWWNIKSWIVWKRTPGKPNWTAELVPRHHSNNSLMSGPESARFILLILNIGSPNKQMDKKEEIFEHQPDH